MASDGKILILKLHDRRLNLLMSGNQILSASVQHDAVIAVGDIYIGKVQNISVNIKAAFVDLGSKNLTFLPMNDAVSAFVLNRKPDGTLKVGDEVLVQVDRAPMKTKLAGVTTKLSLPGQYAVVGIRSRGQKGGVQVSSKLDAAKQEHFRGLEELLRISERFRLIVRTNAGTPGREEALLEEARTLSDTLAHILEIAASRTCYSCLYRTKADYVSFVENAYRNEYDEVITDLPEVYDTLREPCCQADIPLRLYADDLLPLYKLYSVEQRLQELTDKKVWLKSGGYLVIEPTEALTVIDVNTGKMITGKDMEQTYLKINLEAAQEIALQLSLRNISGIIIVDFINMRPEEHNRQLMSVLGGLLKKDPVRTKLEDITALGLVEITRMKKEKPLYEQFRKGKKENTHGTD